VSRIDFIKAKILSHQQLEKKIQLWRFQNKRLVFTNGCFDLLHPGHIKILTEASEYGDVLIVGLNADSSVKKLKGNTRPILNENDRAILLASLQVVDAVVLFDEETPLNLIETITPQVLVKGGDYVAENIVGYSWVTQHGGEVKIITLLEGYSTTKIISKM
jgi:D-beta-D-heptose 7-phosphate kinase/D-beta-D-heptose 1-phosphate adenosyltransferase